MAIISQVPGVAVEVFVAGQKAKEYDATETADDEATNGVSKTCYIESQSGAVFAIDFSVGKNYQRHGHEVLVFGVYIDGLSSGTYFCTPPEFEGVPVRRRVSKLNTLCPETGRILEHELMFADVEPVEAAEHRQISEDKERAKKLGLIEVRVWAGHKGPTMKPIRFPKVPDQDKLRISEKAMKGSTISHGTAFTQAKIVAANRNGQEWNGSMLCQFRFKYRSRKALEDDLIIPIVADQTDKTLLPKTASEPGDSIQMKREVPNEGDQANNSASRPAKKLKTEHRRIVVDLTQD